ncbi:MAG: YfiR family protein, partial [Candidatus Sulfotelmatobacter sp.]
MATRRLTCTIMFAALARATDAKQACETAPGKRAHSTAVLVRRRGVWRDHCCLLGRILLWATAIALYSPSGVHAQEPTEYQVKATYLYNFSQFVQWPTHSIPGSNSFDICVLGQDPFGSALNAILANETIAGKRVAAKSIPTPQDALNCRVLFISSSESGRVKEILT